MSDPHGSRMRWRRGPNPARPCICSMILLKDLADGALDGAAAVAEREAGQDEVVVALEAGGEGVQRGQGAARTRSIRPTSRASMPRPQSRMSTRRRSSSASRTNTQSARARRRTPEFFVPVSCRGHVRLSPSRPTALYQYAPGLSRPGEVRASLPPHHLARDLAMKRSVALSCISDGPQCSLLRV